MEARDSIELARLNFAIPTAGYGGHEIVLSPCERHAAVQLFSGQSQLGYELFAIAPALKHIGGMPYEFGQGHSPAFSPDGNLIALAWAINPGLAIEDSDGDGSGPTTNEHLVDWARIRIQCVSSSDAKCSAVSLTSYKVLVRMPLGSPHENEDAYYPEELEVSSGEVGFVTPWGERVRIGDGSRVVNGATPSPFPESIIVQGPPVRERSSC